MINTQASRHALRWVPPFVVGLCAAACAEVAVGLLLYAGPGLMRSLTTVLSVEAVALGIGLWTAPSPRPDLLDALRRRWLVLLASVLVATLYTAFWTVVGTLGGDALGQGLGLAVLAGLPLYACGAVLGGMGSVETHAGARSGVGVSAVLGAAAGFILTGVSLPLLPTPASLLLLCLVLLSLGGLVYGSVLDTRVRVHVRARRSSSLGEVRVEDRYLLSQDRSIRVLMEGEHVRRCLSADPDSPGPWDLTVFDALPRPDGAARVLILGGGASNLPRAVVRSSPDLIVDVAERTAAVVELAREHLETGLNLENSDRVSVHIGNLDDVLEGLSEPYDVAFVDTSAMAPAGGAAGLSSRARGALWARLSGTGLLAAGPLSPRAGSWTFPEGTDVAHYQRAVDPELSGLGIALPSTEVVVLARRDGSEAPWPDHLGDFARTDVT